MNVWLLCGAATLSLLAPCLVTALRGSPTDRLLGLELATPVAALGFVLLAEGFDRSIYFDLALTYVAVSFATNLVFVRFLERWV